MQNVLADLCLDTEASTAVACVSPGRSTKATTRSVGSRPR